MRIESLITGPGQNLTIVDDTGEYRRDEVVHRVAKIARCLEDLRISETDVVVLLAENGARLIEGLFAILSTGATAAVIDPALPTQTIGNLIASARARVVCCAGGGRINRAIRLLMPSHEHVLDITNSEPGNARMRNARSSSSDELAALILYSSGTTGEPKGIALSHRALATNVRAIAEYLEPTAADSFLILKSMVHSSTLVGEVLVALSAGAKIIAPNPLVSPNVTLRRIRELRPTIIGLNPSILRLFIRGEFSASALQSVRLIHVSGSIMEPAVLREFKTRFPFIQVIVGYGLTEAGPRVSYTGRSSQHKVGSVGLPVRNVEIVVRRPNGENCAPEEVGEVLVRSPSLFAGYFIAGELRPPLLHEGFFPTRDLGYRDRDGDLFITGRVDDLIVTGSHKVNPVNVEQIIRQVIDVSDCVVFGVDDTLLGSRIVCAYTTEQTAADEVSRVERSIRNTCRDSLASFQSPKTLLRWDTIPVGPGGKKSRQLARQRYEQGQPQ